MLNIFGAKQRFCDGVTRRNFLKIGAFGAGLTLADMLRLKATGEHAAAPATVAAKVGHHDLPARRPVAHGHVRPQAGGPDGISAASSSRSRPTCPACRFANTCRCRPACGTSSPCVRSIVSVDEHSDSLVMTGYSENTNRTAHHPSFGSVMSQLRGNASNDIPPFVSLRGMSVGTEPGYLGVAHRPFTPNGPGLRQPRVWPTASTSTASTTASGLLDQLRHRPPRHRRHAAP